MTQIPAGGKVVESATGRVAYIRQMKRKAPQVAFDHEAANMPMPERVSRRKLIGGKYARVSTLKLAPSEKPKDPIAELLRIREEILREQAEEAARKNQPVPSRKAA